MRLTPNFTCDAQDQCDEYNTTKVPFLLEKMYTSRISESNGTSLLLVTKAIDVQYSALIVHESNADAC